ncbi:MAG: Wzz/FepE/Etk N-terminal domain-containing protein [Bryobacteraceae bacterium]
MHDSFDVFEYIDFLRARWKFPAIACGLAILAALVTGFLLPRRYTSTATILIDPPAGGDPRIATAVSTVYLESLKTYELLATNDQLFLRAATKFHLRDSDGAPIESLKRKVLKVDKLRDTRALQISVTLPDPGTAQAVAQFIAEGAVELSRTGGKEADDATIQDAAAAAATLRARLDEAGTAWRLAAGAHPAEALRSEISDDSFLKSRVEEQLLDDQTNAAASDTAASRARIELLQRRISELTKAMDEKGKALATQSAREEDLRAALTSARAAYETAAQRLVDLRVSRGSRSEWLRMIDPGIIPQRPSSPKVPLIVIGAAALALFASFLYLTVSFSLTRGRRRYDLPLRMASHGND